MANQTNSKAKALLGWMDARFPLSKMWNEHLAQYYAPKNRVAISGCCIALMAMALTKLVATVGR